jgi:hypothetical protein
MRTTRLLAVLLAFALAPVPARATSENDDWALLGGVLALAQSVLRAAVASPDPRAAEREIDAILSGSHPEANRLGSRVFAEAAPEMPAEVRASLGAIARDLVLLARLEQARAAARGGAASSERDRREALQARRELAAIGLAYYDPAQFLDAVQRDDALAVELYVLGRGVNLAARDAGGHTALEIARRAGNRRIASLLEGAGAK